MIIDPDHMPRCTWPQCSSNASVQVYTEDQSNSAWLCAFHKRAAYINLEQYGKIFAPESARGKLQRPGSAVVDPMPQIKPTERPGQPIAPKVVAKPDWKKEAAKIADARALPDKKKIEDVKPAPRKR